MGFTSYIINSCVLLGQEELDQEKFDELSEMLDGMKDDICHEYNIDKLFWTVTLNGVIRITETEICYDIETAILTMLRFAQKAKIELSGSMVFCDRYEYVIIQFGSHHRAKIMRINDYMTDDTFETWPMAIGDVVTKTLFV